MKPIGLSAFALIAAALAGSAFAQMPKQLVIASERAGGASNVMANSVASIITKYSGTNATVRGVGSAGAWVSMYKSKEIDFGLTSITEIGWTYWGLNAYQGQASPEFRLVALGTPQTWSFLVPKNANVRTPQQFVSWVKGKRLTHKWINPVIDAYNLAALANLGINSLEEANISAVPVTSYAALSRIWTEQRTDVIGSTIGVPVTDEMNIGRPVQFVSLYDTPEALAKMQKVESGVYLTKQPPGPTGIDQDITALTYDYVIVARNSLEPAAVEKVLETLHKHQAELVAIHPLMKEWGPAEQRWVHPRASMPYHPAAIAYYKKVGLWNAEMDRRQAELEAKTPKS